METINIYETNLEERVALFNKQDIDHKLLKIQSDNDLQILLRIERWITPTCHGLKAIVYRVDTKQEKEIKSDCKIHGGHDETGTISKFVKEIYKVMGDMIETGFYQYWYKKMRENREKIEELIKENNKIAETLEYGTTDSENKEEVNSDINVGKINEAMALMCSMINGGELWTRSSEKLYDEAKNELEKIKNNYA